MPEVACHQVLRVVRFAEQAGLDVAALLRRCGTTLAALDPPTARVPYALADRLVVAIAEALGHDDFGPAVATVFDIEHLDAAGLSVLTAKTVREVMTTLAELQRAWADGEHVIYAESDDVATVRFCYRDGTPRADAIATEFAMNDVWTLVRGMSGRADLVPSLATVTHHRLGPALGDALGLAPRYAADDCRLTFPRALLDLATAPPLALLHQALASKARRELPPDEMRWPERVRAHISRDLALGIDDIAALLHMSTRTLQRRLAEHGTSFDMLLDDARHAKTRALLASGMPLKEICFEVGFSEPSALARARKRWGV